MTFVTNNKNLIFQVKIRIWENLHYYEFGYFLIIKHSSDKTYGNVSGQDLLLFKRNVLTFGSLA